MSVPMSVPAGDENPAVNIHSAAQSQPLEPQTRELAQPNFDMETLEALEKDLEREHIPHVGATGGAKCLLYSRALRFEAEICEPVDQAGAAIHDVYEVHKRLMPRMVVDVIQEWDSGIVTFATVLSLGSRLLLWMIQSVAGPTAGLLKVSDSAERIGRSFRVMVVARSCGPLTLGREIGGFVSDVMKQALPLIKQKLEQA